MTNQFLLSLSARLIYTGTQIYCFVLLKRNVSTELFNEAGLLIALLPLSSLLTLGVNKYLMNIDACSRVKVMNILFYSTITSLLISLPLVSAIIYLELFSWISFFGIFFFLFLNSNINVLQDSLRLMRFSKFVDFIVIMSSILSLFIISSVLFLYNLTQHTLTYYLIFTGVSILNVSLLLGIMFKAWPFYPKNKIFKVTSYIKASYLYLLMGIMLQTCLSTMLPVFMSIRLSTDEVSRFIVEQRFQVGFLIIPSTFYMLAWPRIKSGEWTYDKLKKLFYKLGVSVVVFYFPLNLVFCIMTGTQYQIDMIKLGFFCQFLSIIYTGWVSLYLNINSLYSIQLKKLFYLTLTAGILLWSSRFDLASFLFLYAVLGAIIFSFGIESTHEK